MAPVKKITFHATFNSQKQIFNCVQQEAAEKIASHFGINLRDVILYNVRNGERRRIAPDAITELMKIEIVNRNEQKNMDTSVDNGASKKMVDGIISKLQLNTTLSGDERKALIEALQTHSTAIFKRKLSEVGHREVHNKKLQVCIPGKESFTQTDPLSIDLNNIEEPDIDEETAKYQLKRLWKPNSKPDGEIDFLMKKTFDERRKMILFGLAPARIIKEQYPALFCVEQVKSELDRIFYPGKCVEFLNNLKRYTPHILHYNEDDGDKVKEVYDVISKARDRAKTQVQKSYAENVGAIFLLARLLDEDFGFIHLIDYAHSSEDIFPYIDASLYSLNKIFFDDILYHIKVEGLELCEASNFPEAILCLMASFFIFNINYPEKCRCTLTVIEKVFLEANDTMDMDDKTQQWIKLLCMREMKQRTSLSKSNSEGKQGRPRRSFLKS